MPKCKDCMDSFGFLELKNGICKSCANKEEKELNPKLNSIMLTTESNPNIDIVERLEIISAECVFGINIFRDLLAGVRDIVGGRSKTSQNALKDARKEVLRELRKEAFVVRANAVIAIDLDYSEFSGGGKSMLFVVATGTAVKIKNITNHST